MYEELGWESLAKRRWCHRLVTLYKIINGYAPTYLAEHIPARSVIPQSLRVRSESTILVRTERYQNSFFPYTMKTWKNLSDEAKSKPSVVSFKQYINNFIRPVGHLIFGIRDKSGVHLLTKIRVNFSDLREHRYNHNFNCFSPVCACGIEEETSLHYILHCPRYTSDRIILLSKISDIVGSNVSVLPDEHLFSLLIYGSNVFSSYSNLLMIKHTITYIRKTERFKTLKAFS